MTPQAPAWGIADLQLPDQGGIVQSSLFKIPPCLRVAIELPLIESGSLPLHRDRVWRSALLIEVGEALAE